MLERAFDMPFVVANAELLFNDLGDACANPDLAAEPGGIRPVAQELRDRPPLAVGQLRRMTWTRVGDRGLPITLTGESEPATDRLS